MFIKIDDFCYDEHNYESGISHQDSIEAELIELGLAVREGGDPEAAGLQPTALGRPLTAQERSFDHAWNKELLEAIHAKMVAPYNIQKLILRGVHKCL